VLGSNGFDLRSRDAVLMWFFKLIETHKIILPAPLSATATVEPPKPPPKPKSKPNPNSSSAQQHITSNHGGQ
jgi:hypothetical protein